MYCDLRAAESTGEAIQLLIKDHGQLSKQASRLNSCSAGFCGWCSELQSPMRGQEYKDGQFYKTPSRGCYDKYMAS